MVHVGIIVHPLEQFTREGSLLGELCAVWRERGIRVSIIRRKVPEPLPDAAIMHVDVTRTPPEYRAFLDRFPVVVNRDVTDISKRHISRQLVTSPGDFDGPVIVKTDNNCRGMPEAYWAHLDAPGSVKRPHEETSWATRRTLMDYPVFASTGEVPAEIWANPNLVVERFLPEREGDRYCIRTWLFLGEEERIARFFSTAPVIKSDNIVGRERLYEVPDELRRLRRALGFDYGKFDFAIVDGRTVLYDANRTPTLGVIPRGDFVPWLTKFSDGLFSFIARPPDIPAAPPVDAEAKETLAGELP